MTGEGRDKGSSNASRAATGHQPRIAPEAEPSAAEALAQRFHEAYERLAPSFSYKTRKASATPWPQVPSSNRALMIAVCTEILGGAAAWCCPLSVQEEMGYALERSMRHYPPSTRRAQAFNAAHDVLEAIDRAGFRIAPARPAERPTEPRNERHR